MKILYQSVEDQVLQQKFNKKKEHLDVTLFSRTKKKLVILMNNLILPSDEEPSKQEGQLQHWMQ